MHIWSRVSRRSLLDSIFSGCRAALPLRQLSQVAALTALFFNKSGSIDIRAARELLLLGSWAKSTKLAAPRLPNKEAK
eukprot:2813392-Pleurochrysis_carterae.AAC.1